jgi:transposase
MWKIKDVLRLRYEAQLSYRVIALALAIGLAIVVDYLTRAKKVGLGWPLPENMDDRDLEQALFPVQTVTGQRRFAEPDYPYIHQELKRKGVTKQYSGRSIDTSTLMTVREVRR